MTTGGTWSACNSARERFGVRQCLGAFRYLTRGLSRKSAKTLAHSKTLTRAIVLFPNLALRRVGWRPPRLDPRAE
jgi:hypothetical protein